jgi:ketosteroid isomerase-like protein
MNLDSDDAEIEAVLRSVRQGHYDKDPAAVGTQFASEAVIFDLAPPLGHKFNVPDLAAWLDTWDGPVSLESRDLVIAANGDLAFCYGLCKVSTRTKPDGEPAEWWQRFTVCLRRIDGIWKIVHEHTSVPFHMDGSFRAAVDLKPESTGSP